MVTRLLAWGAVALAAPFPVPAFAADRVAQASSGLTPDPGDIVLFPMDEVSIPWRDNLKLTLQTPQKYSGNPVMKAGPVEGPDGYGVVLYGTVIKEEGRFRMWYLASARPDSRIPGDIALIKDYRPIAYADSSDGIHWRRPSLELVEFRGSRENNLLPISPESQPYAKSYDFVAVLHDRADPDPDRRYKMAYITHGQVNGAWPSTATAVSPDGLRWTLVNAESFTKGHFENTSLIRFKGLYYVAGQDHPPYDAGLLDGSPAGRVMKIFFSPNFRHWSGERALAFYRADYTPEPFKTLPFDPGQENHMGAGLWNRGDVIIGFYGRWYGNTIDPHFVGTDSPLHGLKMDLGLIISNDAIHYREPVRNFIEVPHGGPGDWDRESVLQANAFANTDTMTYIWYSNWDTRAPYPIPPLPQPISPNLTQSIGLLTLPRDRFGCFSKLLLQSPDPFPRANRTHGPEHPREAACLTKSLRVHESSCLFANVDGLDPSAGLEISLVDDAEVPLEGYTATLTGKSLKEPVRWKRGANNLPTDQAFRIKVRWAPEVTQAKLYALYIEHR